MPDALYVGGRPSSEPSVASTSGAGTRLTSDSTLQLRSLPELTADLGAAGLDLADVRDAPDRPGLEHVLVARRPA